MYEVQILYDVRLTVRDGVQLSANLFLPTPRTPGERFPAILEMIPYRKDDWRYNTDHSRMIYLAQHGYGCCRLDVRGTGSSGGVAYDEYTEAETQDGCDAVAWLARQPWCSGSVGMWGVSYGGFTAIQVAMQRPPALKAIFPVYATDDRYTDDVHYLGGCKTVSEMAQYAVSQVAMNALPPRPTYTGADWQAQWRQRLEQTPPWTLAWLRHQHDGPYWRRGSLAPDYSRITCAIYHVGGWNDGYTNAALRMHEFCSAPRKTLVGNWVHAMPDYAYPGPNLDWLHELLRFFACWLKGIDSGVMAEPGFTYFRRQYTPPETFPAVLAGEWCAEPQYPPARTATTALYFGAQTLTPLCPQPPAPGHSDVYTHRPTWGTAGGLCFGAGMGPNGLAGDLRPDEALAVTYTSAPLTTPLDILGIPHVVLHLRCTAPVAHVVVRLADVAPDGTSALVTTGVLNLTHRSGHTAPAPLDPDEIYTVRVPLKAAGYRFLPGQRIRVAVAGALWPVIWPSPYPCDTFLYCGPAYPSRLELPVLPSDPRLPEAPNLKFALPELPQVGSGHDVAPRWEIVTDRMQDTVSVRVRDGNETIVPGEIVLYTQEELDLTAHVHAPAAVALANHVVYRLKVDGSTTEVVATGAVHSTHDAFLFDLQVNVEVDGQPFFARQWHERIPRDLL
jgi:putative CocE/NonD family hydrolase